MFVMEHLRLDTDISKKVNQKYIYSVCTKVQVTLRFVFTCSRSNCVILYYYIGVSKEGFLQKSKILGNDNTGTTTRI